MIYIIGNPTWDLNITKYGQRSGIGGTVFYSSLAIKKLGYEVGVVSKGDKETKKILNNLGINTSYFYEGYQNIRFENDYTGSERKQRAIPGEKINIEEIPKEIFYSDAILVGPVLGEVDPDIVTRLVEKLS